MLLLGKHALRESVVPGETCFERESVVPGETCFERERVLFLEKHALREVAPGKEL